MSGFIGATWRKPTRSNNGGECIEAADNRSGMIDLRDSKDLVGPGAGLRFGGMVRLRHRGQDRHPRPMTIRTVDRTHRGLRPWRRSSSEYSTILTRRAASAIYGGSQLSGRRLS